MQKNPAFSSIYLNSRCLAPNPFYYVSAYQMLRRVAKVKTGDKVLINGASGSVGTALSQLGQLAGLKMFGTASPNKHRIVTEHGAIPMDYHTQDFVEVIRQAEPNGLDFVFEGMGGAHADRALSVLRRAANWWLSSRPNCPCWKQKKANELLENGQVAGNVVLLSPELL